MFTEQNYMAIAEIIRQNQPGDPQRNDYCAGKADALEHVTEELTNYFAADNPHFNRQKFFEACGI